MLRRLRLPWIAEEKRQTSPRTNQSWVSCEIQITRLKWSYFGYIKTQLPWEIHNDEKGGWEEEIEDEQQQHGWSHLLWQWAYHWKIWKARLETDHHVYVLFMWLLRNKTELMATIENLHMKNGSNYLNRFLLQRFHSSLPQVSFRCVDFSCKNSPASKAIPEDFGMIYLLKSKIILDNDYPTECNFNRLKVHLMQGWASVCILIILLWWSKRYVWWSNYIPRYVWPP